MLKRKVINVAKHSRTTCGPTAQHQQALEGRRSLAEASQDDRASSTRPHSHLPGQQGHLLSGLLRLVRTRTANDQLIIERWWNIRSSTHLEIRGATSAASLSPATSLRQASNTSNNTATPQRPSTQPSQRCVNSATTRVHSTSSQQQQTTSSTRHSAATVQDQQQKHTRSRQRRSTP